MAKLKKTKKPAVKSAKKKAAKSGTTKSAVYMLIDRSGSMASNWKEVVSAINGYVAGLKKAKDKSDITLAVFDGYGKLRFNVLRAAIKVDDWTDVSEHEVLPDGMTPLYDAIGAITKIAFEADKERSVLVIMTDGHENDSKEISRVESTALLDKCKAKGWEVIFLGANFNAAPQASWLNVQSHKTLNIAPGMFRTASAMMSAHTSSYNAVGNAMNFTQGEQELTSGGLGKLRTNA